MSAEDLRALRGATDKLTHALSGSLSSENLPTDHGKKRVLPPHPSSVRSPLGTLFFHHTNMSHAHESRWYFPHSKSLPSDVLFQTRAPSCSGHWSHSNLRDNHSNYREYYLHWWNKQDLATNISQQRGGTVICCPASHKTCFLHFAVCWGLPFCRSLGRLLPQPDHLHPPDGKLPMAKFRMRPLASLLHQKGAQKGTLPLLTSNNSATELPKVHSESEIQSRKCLL